MPKGKYMNLLKKCFILIFLTGISMFAVENGAACKIDEVANNNNSGTMFQQQKANVSTISKNYSSDNLFDNQLLSIENAIKKSKNSKKPIFGIIGDPGCPYFRQQLTDILKNKDIATLLKNDFEVSLIFYDDVIIRPALTTNISPTLVLLDEEGELMTEKIEGYVNVKNKEFQKYLSEFKNWYKTVYRDYSKNFNK